MFVFAAIGFLYNSKDLTAPVHMLNGNANCREFTVVLFFGRRQLTIQRLFDGGQAVRIEFEDALIPRIGIGFELLGDPEPSLFQQPEIMRPPFPTDHQENLKRLEVDKQVRFDRMPFLFARIILLLVLYGAFNRLFTHVKQQGGECLV